MPGRPSSLAVFGFVVIALVVGTAIGSVAFPMTQTLTTTEQFTLVSTQTVVSLVGETLTRNVTLTQTQENLAVPCSSLYPDGTAPPNAPLIFARQDSTVSICVRYFYYNFTSPVTFNTTALLTVGISRPILVATSYGAGPRPEVNFSVSSFPSELTLGGNSNLNEGALVFYSIGTGATSNGTYGLNLGAWLHPTLPACAGFTRLIVSNPAPNYVSFGSCTASMSGSYPLNPYGFVDGFLTAKVVGMSNST